MDAIHPYALATVILTRELHVCYACGSLPEDCDHIAAPIVPVRVWRPAVVVGSDRAPSYGTDADLARLGLVTP